MLNFIGLALLLLSWMQPLHFLPWMSWHSEAPAFLATLLLSASVMVQVFKSRNDVLAVPHAVWPLLLLMAVVVLQVAFRSIFFVGDGVVYALYIVLCIFALIVGFHASLLDGMAFAMLVGAVCSVFVELVQALDVWTWATWISFPSGPRRPGGNLGQPNQLATLLLMGISSLVYLFESRRASALFAAMLGLVLLLGLAITESRTGIVALMVMGGWLFISIKRVHLRIKPISAVLALLVLVVLMWVWPQVIGVVYAGGWSEAATSARVDSTAGARVVVWPQLWDAALQRPWLGWGLGQLSKAHNAVLHKYEVGAPFAYAHNIVLDFAVGVGFLFTSLLLIVVVVWVGKRAKAVSSLLPWYGCALALPVAVHSMLEFPFAYAYFLLPVMVAIGAVERALAPSRVFGVPKWLAAGVLTVATAAMACAAWEYIQVEADFRVVRMEARNVGKTPMDYERPQIVLLTQMSAMLEASRLVPEPDMSTERIELVRQAAMRFPWTATQNRYALTLALNGNPDEARRQIKVMRAMHGEPTHRELMEYWKWLASTKYPQLNEVIEP